MSVIERIGAYGKEKIVKKTKDVATKVRRNAAKLGKKEKRESIVSNKLSSVTANKSAFNCNGGDVYNVTINNNYQTMTAERLKELFQHLVSDDGNRSRSEAGNEACKINFDSEEVRSEMEQMFKQEHKGEKWMKKQLAKIAKKWKKIHWPKQKRTDKLPKCNDERKAILYLVQANEPLTVITKFSGGTEFTWHYNCTSANQARFTETINAKDDEKIVLLYVYGNGCRDITRVRKDSDHHLQIFKEKSQVVPIYYDNGQTVVATNYQTRVNGCALDGRKYEVTGELHKQGQLFGKHFNVTADNCHIIESEAFKQNRAHMITVCPELQRVYDLVDAQRAQQKW